MIRKMLIAILVMHTLVSLWVFKDNNILEVFPPYREQYVYQIFSDLVAATGIVFLFIYSQLKKKGRSPTKTMIGLTVATYLLGSPASLIYLIKEKDLFD